jgi:hypothetical protein
MESSKSLGCIIFAAIEAPVNEGLDASSQWLEEGGNYESRGDYQYGVLSCLPRERMREGLESKDEAHVGED